MLVRRISGVLVVLGVIVAGCTGEETADEQSVIRIGLEGPITGEQASNGVDMLRGARLAVEEANAEGGVLGRRIELMALDDQADPEVGVEVVQDAVDAGVFAVVGPYNSSVGVENLPIYLDNGIIPIHLTTDSETNGMGFTIQPKDYQLAPIEAAAISDFFGARRVAVLYDPSTFTKGIAFGLRDLLEEAGVSIVAFQKEDPDTWRSEESDLVRRVMAEEPDFIYASTYFPEGAWIAQDILDLENPPACLMGLANQDPGFVEIAGLEAARACPSSGVPDAAQFPQAQGYVEDYRDRFGTDPGTWGTFTYDSVKLLFDAVRRAESWDSDAVNDELTATEGYEGITGTTTIDESNGNRVDVPVVILDVNEEGSYVVDPEWAEFAGFGA
ncbi:MAG: branched-chain amino acid ABC transporter substrate-binding protein [Acidimicrobiia bacterium]